MKKIAVIGGGPAGFMAAVVAGEESSGSIHIDIFDKDIPLKTILYTGNGRCNLSNEIYDYKELASNYPRGEKFLYSIFNRFGVRETLDWFTRHGVETYVQEDKRIFPITDKAATIREMFLKNAKNHSINIISGLAVEKIAKTEEKFIVFVGNSKKEYDKLVIATGGSSRKQASSGYNLAKTLGHTITELRPSLTSLIANEKYIPDVAGISVKNAEISAYYRETDCHVEAKNPSQKDRSFTAKFRGDFVFTHKGISGPVIFKISAYTCYLNYSKDNPLLLKINYVPDMDRQTLEKDLLEEFNTNPHKSLDNILKKYLPKSLINVILKEQWIDAEKKASQITKDDRKKILRILTENELTIISPEPDGEMVTAGGVSLKEINPKTMESKLVNGLYFCGEVMDIDGLTGGFNLQVCWSTGYIAVLSISKD